MKASVEEIHRRVIWVVLERDEVSLALANYVRDKYLEFANVPTEAIKAVLRYRTDSTLNEERVEAVRCRCAVQAIVTLPQEGRG